MPNVPAGSSSTFGAYVRRQSRIAGLVNVVLNPLLAWLAYRRVDFLPLWAGRGVVVDLAVTSVILSLLVALFMTNGLRRDLGAGRVVPPADGPRAGPVLARLPGGAWSLGLLLGVTAAGVAVAACGLLHALGESGVPLSVYLLAKAVYCGVLGYVVARWVLLRRLPVVSPTK